MTTPATLLQSLANVTVADADKLLTNLEADYNTAKAKIAAVVQTHITAHQAAVAAHQAEVDAATAVLAKAYPTAAPTTDKAAAIILTAPNWIQKAVTWTVAHWQTPVLAIATGIVVYGFKSGLIRF